jgi:hypothetical protein
MRPQTWSALTRHLTPGLMYVLVLQDVTAAPAQTPALQTPRVGHSTPITRDGAAVVTGRPPEPGGAPLDSAEKYIPRAKRPRPSPSPSTRTTWP